jgi:hypothetical protein
MATIGKINVLFGADPGGLKKGVDESVDSLSKLRDGIAETNKELEQFNKTMAAQAKVAEAALNKMDVEKQIRIDADFAAVEDAAREVDNLATSIESEASPTVRIEADASGVAAGANEATGFLSQFQSSASEVFQRTGDDAIAGARRMDTLRVTSKAIADGVVGTYSVIQNAARATSSAIDGIGVAATTLGRAGKEGFAGFEAAADGTIVAVGRTFDAVSQLREVGDNVKTALLGTVVGAKAFASTIGGVDKIVAAVGGSAAASSQVIGSLGSIFASAATSIVTYSAIVAGARVATAGMSEEAQAYAERGAQFVGALAGARAGALAGSAAYRTLAAAIFSSNSATEASQKLFTILGNSVTQAAAKAQGLVSTLARVASVLTLVSAASEKNQTSAGFAAIVAQSVGVTAAFGAVSGAATNLIAGQSALAGATAGATGAMGGLLATFPATAALAVTAAVATGRFSNELRGLGSAAESTEQLAERFGATTQEMERLKLAAEFSGVSLTQLSRAQQSFFSNLGKVKIGQLDSQPVREAKIAFDKLGLSIEDLKSKDPREVFAQVADKLTDVQDPAERTAIAMDLLGQRGAMILPALKEFGDLAKDFDRLGGALNKIDFERFSSLEQSFDRADAASKSLGRSLLIPFTEVQKAFNNFSADVSGGLSKALAPMASMIADITKPIAVVIEAFGRMLNVILRIVGVFTSLAASLQIFSSIAAIFQGFAEGFQAAIQPLEDLVAMLTSGSAEASVFKTVFDGMTRVLNAVGKALGFLIGLVANVAVGVAVAAAAWGIYTVAVALASATSLTAAVSFAAAWAAALLPITIVVAALAALGAAVYAVVSAMTAGAKWLYKFGQSIGLIGKDRKEIDAVKASTEELAASVAAGQKEMAAQAGAMGKAMGVEPVGYETIKETVDNARNSLGELTIEAAKFGDAGADVASTATTEFNKLQQQLGKNEITLAEFRDRSAEVADNLRENLDAMKDDSPEITLKKNLELYKQLDGAVKQAGKSIRDLTAIRQVDDKLLPASEEVKRRANEYKAEFAGAIEEIKKKQQSGGFQKEIDQKKTQLEDDFKSGKVDSVQYAAMKLELDSTNAQEQASIAAEEVQREFDRKQATLKADLSFADDIRKKLEDAFTSPVQKMEKELKKIAENPDLNPSEKASASFMVKKEAQESLVGKSAQSKLTERTRDLTQARDSGLISDESFGAEMKAAMDDLASAVGVTKTPFESFSSSLDNIAKQFGFAGQPLDEVRKKLAGNAEQLALFDRAVQEARDNLLSSLGVEKSPQKVFEEQMKKIDEAVNATDPSKKITEEEAKQARAAATRKRDSELGAGEDLGGQFADRQKKINEAFGGGKDPAKEAIANNKLAIDRRQAAGLDATPTQALKAGVDKINDAFGVTGKSMAEIRSSLSPKEFAEYQEAIKKNSDAVKASLGVEKTGAEKIAESRQKLAQAVADGVVTQKEADKAIKDQKDSLLSSLGITKSPAEDFEAAVAKIQENAAELSPDEIAEGMKEAKDKLLASLGIDDSPTKQATERMKDLSEAFQKGQISADEFAEGMQKTRDTMLQSLGIPLDPVTQLAERMGNLDEALSSGLITQEEFTRGQEEAKKSLLPGGEEESPVKKFQRDLETLQKANSEGLISDEELADRKSNLQAELQESLGPALDNLKPDRRGVEGADVRSKAGVDTFFRILRGNDNPSLKAQLEVARNTKILAEAAKNPEAAPVLAMIGR